MKKIFILMSVLFVLASAFAVFAADVNVTVDGAAVNFPDGQGAVIVDGRTLVPVRGVFETLGFDVEWDGDTRTAILTGSEYVLRITVDSDVFTVNGESRTLDVPARIINGRTMVPIRLPLESVGINVGWDSGTGTVLIGEFDEPAVSHPPADGWDGNVFTSHYFGVRFTAPSTWTVNWHETADVEADVREVFGDVEIDADGFNILMTASSMLGQGNVMMEIEQLHPAERDMTESAYLTITAFQLYLSFGEQLTISPEFPVRIGEHEWSALDLAVTIEGITLSQRYIVSIQDGVIRSILITTGSENVTVEDIWAMFSPI